MITCNHCNIATQRNIPCEQDVCAAWFAGRLPDGWFQGQLEVRVDRDEIVVLGILPAPTNTPGSDAETGEESASSRNGDSELTDVADVAVRSRIGGFREDTRMERMKIAEAGQLRWQRRVSWAVRCGQVEMVFTNASVPVMTRLRFEDRQVLDTLINSGVARSRSEAMAWCVSQVREHQDEWFVRLREAVSEMERIRAEGPGGQTR